MEDIPLSSSMDSFEKVDINELLNDAEIFSEAIENERQDSLELEVDADCKFNNNNIRTFLSNDAAFTTLPSTCDRINFLTADHDIEMNISSPLGRVDSMMSFKMTISGIHGSDGLETSLDRTSLRLGDRKLVEELHEETFNDYQPPDADDFRDVAMLLSNTPLASFNERNYADVSEEKLADSNRRSSQSSCNVSISSNEGSVSRGSSSQQSQSVAPLPRLPTKMKLPEEIRIKKDKCGRASANDLFGVNISGEVRSVLSTLLDPSGASKPPVEIKVEQVFVRDSQPKKKSLPVMSYSACPTPSIAPSISSDDESLTDSNKKKSKYQLLQEKKQKRLIRNRMSAQLHRQKKKEEAEQIDSELKDLRENKETLLEKVERVVRELDAEKNENATLRNQLWEQTQQNHLLSDEVIRLRQEVQDLKNIEVPENLFEGVEEALSDSEGSLAQGFFSALFPGSDSSTTSTASESDTEGENEVFAEPQDNESKKRGRAQKSMKSIRGPTTKKIKRAMRKKLQDFGGLVQDKSKTTKVLLFAFAFFLSVFNIGNISWRSSFDAHHNDVGVRIPMNDLLEVDLNNSPAFLFKRDLAVLGTLGADEDSMETRLANLGSKGVVPRTVSLSVGAVQQRDVVVYGKKSDFEIDFNFTKELAGLSLRESDDMLAEIMLVPSGLVLGSPEKARELYLPVTKTKIMDLALARQKGDVSEHPVNSPSILTLDEPDTDDTVRNLQFKKELWNELSRLTTLLKSKNFIELPGHDNGPMLKSTPLDSQAVVLYRPSQEEWDQYPLTTSNELLRIRAIQSALTSYLNYLSMENGFPVPGSFQAEPSKSTDEKPIDSFILCPSAYGFLQDFSLLQTNLSQRRQSFSGDVDNATLGNRSAHLRGTTKNDIILPTRDLVLDMKNPGTHHSVEFDGLDNRTERPRLTLIVPSRLSVGGGQDEKLVELTCRVETVKDLATNNGRRAEGDKY